MCRRTLLPGVAFLALLPALHGQDTGKTSELQQALALEKTVQKVIRDNEPSIASILVSRSDLYARFGQPPSADQPGKLGAFDREALQNHPLFKELSAGDRKTLLRKLDLTDETTVPESFASGVVVDDKGLVLVPYHAVFGATRILVRLPGNKHSYADIHAADPRSDLAVLRLLDGKLAPRAVRLGDGGKLDRGQFVVGLAFPFAPGVREPRPAAAWGLVANLHRKAAPPVLDDERGKTLYDYGLLVQTDARVHPGCSGAVLFNLQGEAVALTSSLAGVGGTDAAGTYAFPLDAGLQRIVAVLKKGQEVEYGFLGVRFEPVKENEGVRLGYVTKGSPAHHANLKMGHVILAVGATPVNDGDDLLRALATQLAGAEVALEVRKPGSPARETVKVTLARYYVTGKVIASDPGNRPYFRGLRVDDTSLLVQPRDSQVSDIPAGVLVSDVLTDSPAARADLAPGKVITRVNDRPVASPRAFYDAVLNIKGPVELTLLPAEAGQPAPKVTLP
jgi:serine protease Do